MGCSHARVACTPEGAGAGARPVQCGERPPRPGMPRMPHGCPTFGSCAAELDPSQPAAPSPYNATRFGDPSELLAALGAAGFCAVRCRQLDLDCRLPAGAWWETLREMPLPFKVRPAACEGRGHRGPACVGMQGRCACLLSSPSNVPAPCAARPRWRRHLRWLAGLRARSAWRTAPSGARSSCWLRAAGCVGTARSSALATAAGSSPHGGRLQLDTCHDAPCPCCMPCTVYARVHCGRRQPLAGAAITMR